MPRNKRNRKPMGQIKPTTSGDGLRRAVSKLREQLTAESGRYNYPLKAPELMAGVVPAGREAPSIAMDSCSLAFTSGMFPVGSSIQGFPGFPYLSNLATRAEYRAFASVLSTEVTREWIKFTDASEDEDNRTSEKIKMLEAEFKRLNVRGVFQKAVEHDCLFGRAQIFIDITGADRNTPLILSPKTIRKGSLARVSPVEAIWTTPSSYNTLDPAAADFYEPAHWFMLGQEVHASRLMTIVTREVPDILKPAFSFAGISLSQLAEPYVDNWLRTRQSVSDLINNFSITALSTDMGQMLTDCDDGASVHARAELFTLMRSNKGLMLLDKGSEELGQINTPLSGLHELQAQSQEQMCSVSRIPAVILTGVSPSGLNVSTDGDVRIFYDWIAAQQEAFWRYPVETIMKAAQLSLFGEIDPDIGIEFCPLFQMSEKEQSDIRMQDANTAVALIGASVIDPSEERERLARSPSNGYQGLDISVVPVPSFEREEPIEGLASEIEDAEAA